MNAPQPMNAWSEQILRDAAVEGMSNTELADLEMHLQVMLESEMAELDTDRARLEPEHLVVQRVRSEEARAELARLRLELGQVETRSALAREATVCERCGR